MEQVYIINDKAGNFLKLVFRLSGGLYSWGGGVVFCPDEVLVFL